MKPLFSIIIPVRIETDYLKETLTQLKKQIFKNYELIVVTDKLSNTPNPASKRNIGAKIAKGQYVAFLDDDSYPDKFWLQNALTIFNKHPEISALGGPNLTPQSDSSPQKASGLVWSSWLGSGGAGHYRNSIQPSRYVTDYPSVNLIVRKTDFDQVGGFKQNHWPGEDTLLCRDLIDKLHKKILYHSTCVVYHHRRSIIIPHLQQIKRYALHRGYFAKKYPENSRLIGYFLPSLFVSYLLFLPIFYKSIYSIPLIIYLVILIATGINFIIKKNNVYTSFLATISIPITHVYYGIYFIIGFFSSNLNFQPHNVNTKKHTYLGG